MSSSSVDLVWQGPFSWPGFESESKLPPPPPVPGVYLLTFEWLDGYLIYAAGLTRRPVPVRLREHTRRYRDGDYTVLDVSVAERGVRSEIWHGWGYARAHREGFEGRKQEIREAALKQLAGLRVFVAAEDGFAEAERLLERVEAGVMHSLWAHSGPVGDVPDRGMHLEGRKDSEPPIQAHNVSEVLLHGLPDLLEI